MIYLHEIRPGNIIRSQVLPVIVRKVESQQVHFSYFASKEDIESDDYLKFRGLDLDHKILLQFGFEKMGEFKFRNQQVSLSFYDPEKAFQVIPINAPPEGASQWGTVRYVHQLQNLYFEYTKQELPEPPYLKI